MSIFIDKKTKLLVQGITGRDGSFHAEQMKKYGTNVVGGVTPGKGGSKVAGIPVFNTVEDAVAKTKANTSIIYVPPAFAVDAVYEAAEAGIIESSRTIVPAIIKTGSSDVLFGIEDLEARLLTLLGVGR